MTIALHSSPDAGYWIPACGGTEVEFRARSGARLLYMWNPVTGRHAYYHVDSDVFLSDEDAERHLMRN